MGTPPIEPTGPSQPTFGGVPADQQAQQDLSQIQDIAQEMQKAIASGNQSQALDLLKDLEGPLHDLQKIASQLSKEEKKLLKSAIGEHQNMSESGDASPVNIAMLQGTCMTAQQLLSSDSGSSINVQALLDTNHLSGLANALQTHLQAHGGHQNQDCQDLINSLNAPSDDLEYQTQAGKLTSDQSDMATAITEQNKLDFQTTDDQGYKTATPEAVDSFQQQVSDLNKALLG